MALPSCLIEKKKGLFSYFHPNYPQNLEPKNSPVLPQKKQWFLLLPSPLTDDKPPKTGGLKNFHFYDLRFFGSRV